MIGQLTAGLPDDAFASDGLLTKRVLRAAALASLAPVGDELLWDLGAGTGSIGIEWCRLSAGNRAVAVERRPERAERIRENAARHQVGARLRIGESGIAAAPPGLVVPSVPAAPAAVLREAYRGGGGERGRVGVETAEPIGRFTGFRPARTVTAWAGVRT